jgi:arylsulfatase A-like enzyme
VRVALAAATAVAVIYPSAAYLRYKLAGLPAMPLHRIDLLVGAGSLLAHILFFGFIIGMLALGEALALRTARPAQTRFLWFTGVAWLTVSLVFKRVVFGAISYIGVESIIYSVLFGLACVIFAGGQVLRAVTLDPLRGDAIVHRKRHYESALLLLVVVIAACVVPAIIGIIDWNSILEKLWVIAFWTAMVLVMIRIVPRPKKPLPVLAALALPVLCYVIYSLTFTSQRWASPESDVQRAIGQQASYNLSYVNVNDLLTSVHTAPCDDYCRYLQEQTNIPPAMPPAAPELDLVNHLERTSMARPNIFVFVVDSLRQDYVTAYNPQVDYTPDIAAFAHDSLVFRNAFSRYAGTTLSEPSIWAGAMLLHTHFVHPFSHVNNLEKLAAIDDYEPFVTVDTTLRNLLEPREDLIHLDEHAAKWTDIDLCSTADDAEAKLAHRKDPTRPVFMFTQPQNVHILTVYKRHPELLVHSKEVIAQMYAQELRRMDGCFGGFMHYLKTKGLYENSIIVLTADHGELGHESHATSVEPDIMRVPLIIHVPEKVRRNFHYDVTRLAFTTDITPSIFYLLGHRPIRTNEIFGRPLITETAAEASAYERPSYLLASSYVAAYGIIRNDGKTFFSISGDKHSEALYNLDADPHGDRNLLTARDAEINHGDVRSHVAQIANAYNFHYQPSTLLGWFLH